jgi:copper chaperone
VRKTSLLVLALLAILSLGITSAFACDKDGANATKASATGCTGMAKAQMTSDKGACTGHGEKMSAAECAAKCASMSPEDMAKACNYDGKVQMIQMSVKGMTCGGCESSIKACLEKIDGVVKVCAVSYKDDFAAVVIDPSKTKSDLLTTAITNKGYTAEVIPAVAAATTGAADLHKGCTAEQRAACATKKTTCETKKDAKTEETSAKQPN